MSRKVFLLKCPHCGNQMKYGTEDNELLDKRKACVYCGKSYKVREHIVKKE